MRVNHDVYFKSLLLLLLLSLCASSAQQHTQYIATVNHAADGYHSNNKRSTNVDVFVGDLIFNNTPNELGEITVSLCDITRDLFGDSTKSHLFNFAQKGGIKSIVNAEVDGGVDINVNIDGCLQFFFNPCCETVGLRFVLDNPVVLSADASLNVNMEAFNLGVSLGTGKITLDPLNNINLGGFSPVLKSWQLPPILDSVMSFAVRNEKYCGSLSLPGVPGNLLNIKFCVELGNFSASLHNINVCPRLTVYVNTKKILDLSYTALVKDKSLPQCLSLGFIPQCPSAKATVPADIMQLFKSIDLNNDFKIVLDEIIRSKALLGVYNTKNTNSAQFLQMDNDADGEVNFDEFHQYANLQTQTYSEEPYAKQATSFSQGDIAVAIIATMLATIVVTGAILVGYAQYKGIVNFKILSKIVPTKSGNAATSSTNERRDAHEYHSYTPPKI